MGLLTGEGPRLRLVGGTAVSSAETKGVSVPPSGGSGDGMNDLEPRVKRLEEDAKEIRSDLKAIRIDLAEIKGKLSGMP